MEQNIAETPVLLNAWAWAEKNFKTIIYAVVGVAVAGLAIGYFNWATKQKEIAAGQALSRALYDTVRAQNGNAADALLKVAAANSGTQAAAQALLLAATELFKAGKYAEAQSSFEQFNRDYATSALAAQALYGVGASLAAQKKFEEAARAYQDSVTRFPNSPIVNQAKYSLAGVLAAQGKTEDAVKRYEEVVTAAPGNSLGNEAMLRADELRAQLPVVPVVPDAAPAAAGTNP